MCVFIPCERRAEGTATPHCTASTINTRWRSSDPFILTRIPTSGGETDWKRDQNTPAASVNGAATRAPHARKLIFWIFLLEMEPLVRIGQGDLQGKVMTSRKGRRIHAFQGIPYAEPPVGELRFQVWMAIFDNARKRILICFVCSEPERCSWVEWRAPGPQGGQRLCAEALLQGAIHRLWRLSLSQCLCAASKQSIFYDCMIKGKVLV